MARIVGERVVLREFRREDLTGMRSWVVDGEATRYLSGIFTQPQTWEQTEHYLNSLLNGDAGGVHLAIADKETLNYLGQCDLMSIQQTNRAAELAIVLPISNCGKGLGAEAIGLLLDFAFEQLNLNRVYLRVHEDNKRAIRCYEKCGFVLEGRLRQDNYSQGAYHDILMMGVLRDERRAGRTGL